MEIFQLNLKVSHLMTYESRDEKKTDPRREKDREKRNLGGGRQNPVVAVVAEVVWRQPTFPLVAGTGIHCWGSREQQWI